ncbi:TetR/AcrR family transcriptional regulator [Gemmatimonas sp.]|uniref:TetR/AcrR family transcriptional regulator n=1 Tax=Gemmatimonas sp. TaxID=1962908 RepID=UPI00356A5B44
MNKDRINDIVTMSAFLFDEHGYHQTTMEDIARAVNLRKPSLYHYVRSKEEILSLIHEEFVELLFSKQRDREENNSPYDEMLHETTRDLIRLMGSHRSHVRVFFEHYRELPPQYREKIEPKRADYFRLIVGYIQSGIDAGQYKVPSAELAGLAMFGMCNWAYTWFRPDGQFTDVEVADCFWAWLDAGFVAGTSLRADATAG